MKRVLARVIVMGGSLGGLNAALYLRRAGCEVTVLERSLEPLAGRGAGIVLHPATLGYLTRHRPLDLREISVGTRYVRYLDKENRIQAQALEPYRFSSYDAIYRRLLDAFGTDQYFFNSSVEAFEQDSSGVTVFSSDGETHRCDLLVCADGIRSSSRERIDPGARLEYAGYIAWRGVLPTERLSRKLLEKLDDAILYHVGPQGHLLTYPIPIKGPSLGQQQVVINWLWYRNVTEPNSLDSLMTDRDGTLRAVSIGPGSVQTEHLWDLRCDARARLPALFSELILKTDQPFLQSVMDCKLSKMSLGRVCLLGDAAFVVRPHAAVGTAKAAEDGRQLGRALEKAGGNVFQALQSWERSQMSLGKALILRNREVGQRLQNGTWPIGSPLAFGLFEPGDSTME